MKLIRAAARSLSAGFVNRMQRPQMLRPLSTFSPSNGVNNHQSTDSSESLEDFEHRIFGDSRGKNADDDSFFQKLDKIERSRDKSGFGSKLHGGNDFEFLEGLGDGFNTLSDGMDGKLKKAAQYFEVNPEEIAEEDYSYRPDMTFWPGNTYETKDLDLTKPAVRKPRKKVEFVVTTEEVLRKADFRNVRFLANFITEAGIIVKRSKTGISAKAQRKVAREIKTARSFGLMPFTTMGTKHFVFGKTMETLEEDYEYDRYDSRTADAEGSHDSLGI